MAPLTQRFSDEPVAAARALTHRAQLTLLARPDTWVSWCSCGWEYEGGWDIAFREHRLHLGQRLGSE